MNTIKFLTINPFVLILSFLFLVASEAANRTSTDPATFSYQWSAQLTLSSTKQILKVDNFTIFISGDSTDPGQIRIATSESDEQLIYRLWPDISKWRLVEKDREIYHKAFEKIPGWPEHRFHLRVDIHPSERQVWLDGRLIKEWQASNKGMPQIFLNGDLQEDIIEIPGYHNRHLVIPLEHYFNSLTEEPYNPDAAINLDGKTDLRYETHTNTPHTLDLGQIQYRRAHLKPGPFQRLSLPYVLCDALSSDSKRAIFRVPARYYDRMHLICYSDGDEGEVPRAMFRFMKSERVRFSDREFGLVPDEHVQVQDTIRVGNRQELYITVDLNPAAWQEFLSRPQNEYLEFELTGPLLMDNNSFMRPGGPSSSLHVLALALEEAPVNMFVSSEVAGHLFENRKEAGMQVNLESNSQQVQTGSVTYSIMMPDDKIKTDHINFTLAGGEKREYLIPLHDVPVGKSKVYVKLSVNKNSGETRIVERETSFAILPEFNRTDPDSPFGMWSFFEGHHGAGFHTTADILRKAGVRGTLVNFVLRTNPEKWEENTQRTAILDEYGIKPNWGHLAGVHRTGLDGLGNPDKKMTWIKAHPQVEYFNLFWESYIKGYPSQTIPPEILGKTPLEWDEIGKKEIETYMDFGIAWAKRLREEAPDRKISIGNGFPLFNSVMLRSGFPHEYIDGLGLDFDMYTSAPEEQPSMWYAPFSGIFYLRELRKLYGYETKPIWLTEAIYCPTSPIWISEREQADYYVRTHLLARAMGVEKFGMCAEPIDPDGWYHYSHYGPVGLCHATPELNPREAFCAYATMTGVLDGARFDQIISSGSPHVFWLRFQKYDNTYVHAIWNVNGSRQLDLKMDINEDLIAYNRDGRIITQELISEKGNLVIEINESPQYLVGPKNLTVRHLGKTKLIPSAANTRSFIRFESLDDWEVQEEPLDGYAAINPATPLAWHKVEVNVEQGALSVRPAKENNTHPLETTCTVLRYRGEPLYIPENTQSLVAHVEGDRTWGRVVFILEDQKGDRWISARSQTPVDVDGEIYLETMLPKYLPGNPPGYTGYRPWERENNDLIPEYPLRLTHLLFETRTHVIHGPELVPLSDNGIIVESVSIR